MRFFKNLCNKAITSNNPQPNTASLREICDVHPNPGKVRWGRGGGIGDGRSGLLPRLIAARNRTKLNSSHFRQSGAISSHLVVEPVETHQRVPHSGVLRKRTPFGGFYPQHIPY